MLLEVSNKAHTNNYGFAIELYSTDANELLIINIHQEAKISQNFPLQIIEDAIESQREQA
jgi:hypothetical protein